MQLSLYLFAYLGTCGPFVAYCARFYSLHFFVESDQGQYHRNEHGKSDFASYAFQMCTAAWVSFGASPSLNMLAISAFAVVEHWLLLFVASLPSYTLVFAFAIVGRWLLFYPFHVDSLTAVLVVLLLCSLENSGLKLSLSLLHYPYHQLFVSSSIFRRFIQTSPLLSY